MFKLLFSEIVHALRHKPILVSTLPSGQPVVAEARDRNRELALRPILRGIEQVQKFIFDSGTDAPDSPTCPAVRETAVNMIDAGLFHLPFPKIWIEDPFDDDPDGMRNFYYAVEQTDCVLIWYITRIDVEKHFPPGAKINGKPIPNIVFHPFPLKIDLTVATDEFILDAPVTAVDPVYGKILGEVVYSLKKFIVTLNAENIESTRVRIPKDHPWRGDTRRRLYDHTIIRVPYDTPNGERSGSGARSLARRSLVRGYMWGKNTRALTEQRWIKPHYRGTQEKIEIVRTHYEVR